MLIAEDYRRISRNSLKNKWGLAVGTSLVAAILGAADMSFSFPKFNINNTDVIDSLDGTPLVFFGFFILALMGVAGVISIIRFVIGGVTQLGLCQFNVNIITNKNAEFKDIFSKYNTLFLNGFLINLITSIFVILWSLLLVVPGIVAAYKYSMAYYIMNDNPNMTATQAIDASKQMMQGNKARLFYLDISFIGWYFLSLLTCGIGFLFLIPYVQVAHAAFYCDLKCPKVQEQQPEMI